MAITYRPSDENVKEIENLKTKLKISTTTKLIDYLVENHSKLKEEIFELKQSNSNKDRKIRDTQHTVSNFQEALNDLLKLDNE